MDNNIFEFINNSTLFKDLPDEAGKELAKKIILHSIKKNDVLIKKGDKSDSVFVIQNGWVKVVITDEEKGEIIITHLGPDELVGELSLLDQAPRSASVVALSQADVLEIKRDDFLMMLNKYPMLGLYMSMIVSRKLRYLITYVEKAIDWSYKIAEGDYSFTKEIIENDSRSIAVDSNSSDEATASRFVSAFFAMAEGVQTREELLLNKVQQLIINFDEKKRDEELESLTNSKYFSKLKSDTQQIRGTRKRTKKK